MQQRRSSRRGAAGWNLLHLLCKLAAVEETAGLTGGMCTSVARRGQRRTPRHCVCACASELQFPRFVLCSAGCASALASALAGLDNLGVTSGTPEQWACGYATLCSALVHSGLFVPAQGRFYYFFFLGCRPESRLSNPISSLFPCWGGEG